MPQESKTLVRAVGLWSLAALMLNTVIGASIFGLPSLLAAHLGRFSPVGYLVAVVGVAAIAACLAEVASQFREAGGPYLYARVAFGPFVAIQIGWLTWLSRTVSAAAVANLFVSYLIQFFPAAQAWSVRAAVLILLVGFLAFVNYRGVTSGTRLSDFFTVTKLLIVLLFIIAAFMALLFRPEVRVTPQAIPVTRGDWLDAILLMINSFSGFEAAFLLSGEARNPRRDAPIALFITLATATLLFVAVQYVVIHTLPTAATAAKPVADAAQRFMGPFGAALIAVGALISVYGSLSANMLHTPRLTFSMGEQGDFPSFFAAVHPRFRTPYISIGAFAVLVIGFSVAGSFHWNTVLSAVSRLFIYASIVAAVPVLRRKQPHADAFRLPGGMFFVISALLFTAVLATKIHLGGFVVLAATFAVALLNWLLTVRYPRAPRVRGAAAASQQDYQDCA
jgi:basic amino acid/polyamine antiporter, APA family